jgi:hypothetical protein
MEEEAMKGNLANPEIAWLFAGSFFCSFLGGLICYVKGQPRHTHPVVEFAPNFSSHSYVGKKLTTKDANRN